MLLKYHHSTPKSYITYSKVGGLVFVTIKNLFILSIELTNQVKRKLNSLNAKESHD